MKHTFTTLILISTLWSAQAMDNPKPTELPYRGDLFETAQICRSTGPFEGIEGYHTKTQDCFFCATYYSPSSIAFMTQTPIANQGEYVGSLVDSSKAEQDPPQVTLGPMKNQSKYLFECMQYWWHEQQKNVSLQAAQKPEEQK